jgi:hypothetical protein
LNGIRDKIQYQLGGQEIIINGKERVPFKDSVVFSQDRLYVPLSFFAALGLVTAYDVDSNLAEIYTPEVTAGAVAGLLAVGQYQELTDRYFSVGLKQNLSVPQLRQSWESISVPAGDYFGIKSTDSSRSEDRMNIQSELTFAKSAAALELILNSSGKIMGLRLERLPDEPSLLITN